VHPIQDGGKREGLLLIFLAQLGSNSRNSIANELREREREREKHVLDVRNVTEYSYNFRF